MTRNLNLVSANSILEIEALFPEMPPELQEVMADILDIMDKLRRQGNFGEYFDTSKNNGIRHQSVVLHRGTPNENGITESTLDLNTEVTENYGLFKLWKQSVEDITLSTSLAFGRVLKQRARVDREITTGFGSIKIGFHTLNSESFDPKSTIIPNNDLLIGDATSGVESFEGQTLLSLLIRFRDRLKSALN